MIFQNVLETAGDTVNTAAMAQEKITLPEHFGRWLYWELRRKYTSRKAIEEGVGRVWKTLETCFAEPTPTGILIETKARLASALGLPLDELDKRYLGHHPQPIPKDPRGRKAELDTLTVEEVRRVRLLLAHAAEFLASLQIGSETSFDESPQPPMLERDLEREVIDENGVSRQLPADDPPPHGAQHQPTAQPDRQRRKPREKKRST